jgi:hypothetical protein
LAGREIDDANPYPSISPLPLDQADVACSRSLGGFLRLKFHTLALSEQLEHSAAYSAAMEEVLDTALIADESESLVDEEACDSPGGHNLGPPMRVDR